MTYLVFLAFIGILASLGTALYYMMRGGQDAAKNSNKMARALAWRVALSIVLFVCILAGWKLGYIHPTGIAPGQ